jgi:glycosyltransferase involved in cell wall biosynthesis
MKPLKYRSMIKVVDVVYHCHHEFNSPQQVIEIQKPAFGFADFVHPILNIQFVKHLNYTGTKKINGLQYTFFKSRNRFWYIPFATHRYIKKQDPGIVMIEGLLFPIQIILLKFSLKKKCKIIARHHGERPFKGIKGFFQRLADKYIDVYLFTSFNNADEWKGSVIKYVSKCAEVLEASTYFKRKEFIKSQTVTGVNGSYNFLWVGRLIAGKDPFTVLAAFEKYASQQTCARLFMIYQENDLLEDVKKIISGSKTLQQSVKLVGKTDNTNLVDWYSAANFFIAGSHREAAGYAILEAMACGCIPVVTAIPSFTKITANGKYGFLYPKGDADALTSLLLSFNDINIEAKRLDIENHFTEQLSFKKIAADISNLCLQLYSVQG